LALNQQSRQVRAEQDRLEDSSFSRSKAALGARLKRLRLDKEMTIQVVAERSDVARSTISKIENGQLSPTFDLLQRLAHGLDIDLSELFNTASESPPAGRRSVTQARTGHVIETREYFYEALSSDLRRKQMFPLRASIRARSVDEFGGWIRHDGEEFLFVISGAICFYTEFYEPARLGVGDSIYIDSRMGHACVSTSPEDAEVIWVCTQLSLDI
jgi:transcriptional regulator with XRE-family HTH domain